MVRAVIFDLDDTLISEKDYVVSGFRHISKMLSPVLRIDEGVIFADMLDLFNNSPKNVFNRLFEKYNIKYSDKMILQLVNEYRSHFPNIKVYSDVLPCLKELKAAGIKTGIITDGYATAQRQKLMAIDADKYFDEIIVTDELGREYWKPHPKAFMLMKKKLNFNYDEMIYIGDNILKDFITSNELGIITVQIKREDSIYSIRVIDKNYIPRFEIGSLVKLIEIISFINNGFNKEISIPQL